MPNLIQGEALEAVVEVFRMMGSTPTGVFRKFSKGTTPGSFTGGQQARLPVGSPIPAVVILAERHGAEEGIADLFVRPETLSGAKDLTSPDYGWTFEAVGSGRQLDLVPARKGAAVWRALGPTPQAPVMWKSRAVEGGAANA